MTKNSHRIMHILTWLLLWCSLACQASAQQPAGSDVLANSIEKYRDTINQNTINVIGASLSGSYIKIIDDIAKAVNDGNKLRVLPIVGEGGAQNVRDILYLKGVDAGLVKWNLVENYEKDPLFANLRNRLQYIALLFGEEFYIVANPGIKSLSDLAGKKIGLHGGAVASIPDLLSKLKIKPGAISEVDFFKGLEQVKTGEIDAVARVTASPMKGLNEKLDPKFHSFISVPLDDSLLDTHLPGRLTHAMYPKFIPEGNSINTVATGIVLAAYGWQPGTDRYRRVAQFTDAFFSSMDKLLADKERHPAWDSVNLAAELPGWVRFPAAQEWLNQNKDRFPKKDNSELTGEVSPKQSIDARGEFVNYLRSKADAPINREKTEELFREYEIWRQSKGSQQQSAR